MIPAELKKWLAFGNGIGIEISGPHGSESLRIVGVRVRPGGARVLDQLIVEDVPHQTAGVWGTEYSAFIRKLGLRHVAATVLLPRQDLIVRQLSLPGVVDRDLPAAVEFQMDGLHPYSDSDDIVSSWARLAGTSTILVAIARRSVVDRYAGWFDEAGIKVAAFSCSAAAIYSALRIFSAPPAQLLAFNLEGPHMELYGESPARAIFSAGFNSPDIELSRAVTLAQSELRVEPEVEARPLDEVLHSPAQPYAAALASACPRLCLPLNLLPREHRQTSSRMQWIPSAVLGAIVLMLAGALAAYPGFEDRRYLRSLHAEIAKVEPRAARAAALDREIETSRRRTVLLDEFRGHSKADMDVLEEMTRILAPPTWVNSLEINRTQVVVAGETDQAAPLIKVIDASPLFQASEFNMPPMHIQNGELFRIRTTREAGK